MIKILSILLYCFQAVHPHFSDEPSGLHGRAFSEEPIQNIEAKNDYVFQDDACDELELLRHPLLNISSVMSPTVEASFVSIEEVNNFLLAPGQPTIIRCSFKSEWVGCVYNIHYYQVNISEIELYADANRSKELLQRAFHVVSVPCETQPTYCFMYVIEGGFLGCFFLYILGRCCYNNRRGIRLLQK